MSRIGKNPIVVPSNVNVNLDGQTITMKSDKGELSYTHIEGVKVSYENNEIVVTRDNDEKQTRATHGLTRTLLNNMVVGLTEGFKKQLEINGVGFKVEVKANKAIFSLGYSHPIYLYPPEGIKITAPSPTSVTVEGIDKELVGEIAAKIRSLRPPEPYKGKGVKYSDETIIRKAGKAGK
jgi:large subunit ribosomal protein L6